MWRPASYCVLQVVSRSCCNFMCRGVGKERRRPAEARAPLRDVVLRRDRHPHLHSRLRRLLRPLRCRTTFGRGSGRGADRAGAKTGSRGKADEQGREASCTARWRRVKLGVVTRSATLTVARRPFYCCGATKCDGTLARAREMKYYARTSQQGSSGGCRWRRPKRIAPSARRRVRLELVRLPHHRLRRHERGARGGPPLSPRQGRWCALRSVACRCDFAPSRPPLAGLRAGGQLRALLVCVEPRSGIIGNRAMAHLHAAPCDAQPFGFNLSGVLPGMIGPAAARRPDHTRRLAASCGLQRPNGDACDCRVLVKWEAVDQCTHEAKRVRRAEQFEGSLAVIAAELSNTTQSSADQPKRRQRAEEGPCLAAHAPRLAAKPAPAPSTCTSRPPPPTAAPSPARGATPPATAASGRRAPP